jgi:hypothetical protein
MDPRLKELTQDLSLINDLNQLSSEEIVNYLKEVITDSQGKKKLKEIEDSLYIIFKFQRDGTVIYDKIPKSRLKNYTNSVVLYNLVSDDWRATKTCDLSEFSHDAFREILKYLDTNKLPQLKKENFDDILELANYIIPGDNYFHDNFNVRDDRFFIKSLREHDLFLITEEKKLRTFLSTNRDGDIDQEFELNKIIKEVRPHCQRKGVSIIIPPPKVSTIAKKPAVKINDDYYGIPFLPTKDSITFPFKVQLDILRFNFITDMDRKIIDEEQITPDDLFNNINSSPLEFLCKEKLIRFLKKLSYKNYCIAGGFLTSDYRETDIDFFITTKNESEAREAILNIYVNAIQNNITDPGFLMQMQPVNRYEEMIIVNDYSITFSFSGFKVQIILRLYNSITEVISGFDVDMSCVAFDGKKFYCMPRFVRSIISKYILVDPERQSTTYAQRLYKYRFRYCDIAIPGIEKHKITSDFDDVQGLAKLLKKIYSTKEFIEDTVSYNTAVLFPNTFCLNTAIIKIAMKHQRNNQIQPVFIIEEAGEQHVIDYVVSNHIEIPFRIVSNIEDVFEQGNNNLVFPYRFIVEGPIKFKSENPGSQVSGSFFPTTEHWYTDLFLN